MNIELGQIANTRSGDKGSNSNVGIIFNNKKIYEWAKKEITSDVVKNHFNGIVKGRIIRYELDNILSMNFILEDSLGGGGSETLINDAQGKTHGQIMMMLKIDIPEHLIS